MHEGWNQEIPDITYFPEESKVNDEEENQKTFENILEMHRERRLASHHRDEPYTFSDARSILKKDLGRKPSTEEVNEWLYEMNSDWVFSPEHL